MNGNMEYEIEKTILRLKASMPERRQVSFVSLLGLAASEMNMALLGLTVIAIAAIGYVLSKALSAPMLTCFCTAPMPVLLLFNRYVSRANEQMRELEQTFRYSCSEMLAARAAVISLYMLLCLLLLSLTIHKAAGESLMRLALCGATPSVFLSALLLRISLSFRRQEHIALIAGVFWVFLCFAALLLPFGAVLQAAHTGLYIIMVIIGAALYVLCLRRIRRGGSVYADSARRMEKAPRIS